jgi:hypothetical protein
MNPLIAIVTCERFKARADAQRRVWTHRAQGMDVRFFLAKQDREPLPDEVFLDVPDDYHSLPLKVKHMFQWALANGYENTLKTDDDTVINPIRLLAAMPPQDYAGFLNATPPKPWCSGFAYWISGRAMRIMAEASIPEGEWAEDKWVGGVLFDHGIKPHWDRRHGLLIKGWRDPDFRTAVAICDCRETPAPLDELYLLIS